MYIIDILQFSTKENLELINKNNNIKEFIENKEDFLNYTQLPKNSINILKNSIKQYNKI